MDRTERLFNLVLALMSTAQPVARHTIRAIVDGYAQSASDSAFERMFERDKDDLRTLGIPIETVTTPEGEVLGYVIPRDDYRLSPVIFTQEQWSLLGVAARAWSQAATAQSALLAVRKVEAVTDLEGVATGDSGQILSWQARPGDGSQWLPVLWGAIRRRNRVGFDYLGLRDESPASRTIEPWSVTAHAGGWYLIGFDVDRQDTRVFRLSRIAGSMVVESPDGAFAIPEHDALAMLEPDDPDDHRIDAWLAIAIGSGHRLRMNAIEPAEHGGVSTLMVPEGFELIFVPDRDAASVCSEIAELGDRAIVLYPPRLQDMVQKHLQRVLHAHADDDDETDS